MKSIIKNNYLESSCAAVLKKEFSQRASVIETCGALLSEIRPEMAKSECVNKLSITLKIQTPFIMTIGYGELQ